MMGCAVFSISTFDNVLMPAFAGVLNAPHYVLYSSKEAKKKKSNGGGGSKLNCCKIWPLGKHDIIY